MRKREIEFIKGNFPSNDKLIDFMVENNLSTHDISVMAGHTHPTVIGWVTGSKIVRMWRVLSIIEMISEKIK